MNNKMPDRSFGRKIRNRIRFAIGMKNAGSVTVEAAMILPLFIMFSLMFVSAFEMLTTYCRMQSILTETATEAAAFLYIKEDPSPEQGESLLISETLIREEITRKAGKKLGGSVIEGDALGLHLFRSDIATDGKTVNLIVTYVVKPWFSFGGIGRMTMANHVSIRAWTGYEITSEAEGNQEEEQTVYITRTGTVYHLYRDCTYLAADAHAVFGEELSSERSEDGSKYYPCELCSRNISVKDGEIYYITPWGNRFHTDSKCTALYKPVEAIPISEAGGRHVCSKCAGREGN